MRRPAGVIVAAVVLGLMACFGLLGVLFALFGMFLIHTPVMPTAMPAATLSHGGQLIMVVFDLIGLCFFAFCAWTAVGLFRMRVWARYSVVVLGIMTAGFGGMTAAVILLVGKIVPARMAASGSPIPWHFGAILAAIGLFYAAIALIGVWWVVYFNLKHVRQAFAGTQPQLDGAETSVAGATVSGEFGLWHGVVIAVAILTLFGGISLLVMGLMRLPLFLYGVVLRGNAALTVALLMAALMFFIGIGLLRRIPSAYWTAIGWYALGILAMAVMLIPSVRARTVAFQTEVSQHLSIAPVQPQLYSFSGLFLAIGNIVGLAVGLFCIYALLRCRRWFAPNLRN